MVVTMQAMIFHCINSFIGSQDIRDICKQFCYVLPTFILYDLYLTGNVLQFILAIVSS